MKRVLFFLWAFFLQAQDHDTLWIMRKTQQGWEVNRSAIQKLSAPEKAILAYYAMRAGGDCKHQHGTLHCLLTDALGLGHQCSKAHKHLVHQWFKHEPEILEDLYTCYKKADSEQTFQIITYIAIKRKGNEIDVFYHFVGHDKRIKEKWRLQGVGKFLVKQNYVHLIEEHEKLDYELDEGQEP